MNRTNYHSHCSFCDGRAPMEEFIQSAVTAGFTAYGVSSHAPLPFETRWSLDRGDVPDYLQEIRRLKEKYAGKIELYAGMEIDYLNEEHHPANSYFQELPLDYRIGSIHLIYSDEGEIIDTDTKPEHFKLLLVKYFKGDLQEMVKRYFNASMRLVEFGGFDFIAHADKISYNAEYCKEGVTEQAWYRECREALFSRIAEKGLMMEINTKAFLKRGRFFPDRKYFAFLRELGISIIVNSDAHFPELINAGRPEALMALKEAGFRTVWELHTEGWREKVIDAE